MDPVNQFALAGFPFALVLSMFMSITMIGLYNVQRAMQDPFCTMYVVGFDDIPVVKVCREIHNACKIAGQEGHMPFVLDDDDGFDGGNLRGDSRQVSKANMCVP